MKLGLLKDEKNCPINSLLWYVFDQIDLVTSDVIFKLILDYYSDEEIENAKEVLHANFKSKSGRKIIRKGNDKPAKNVEDILKILHEMSAEMEKEAVPILVTDSSRFLL